MSVQIFTGTAPTYACSTSATAAHDRVRTPNDGFNITFVDGHSYG